MEADLADRQQKLDDYKQRNRDMYDEHNARMRELGESVREQAHFIDTLNAQLEKASANREDVVKSLNTEHSLAMVERLGIEREQLQRQLTEMEVAKAESERSLEEAVAEDQRELTFLRFRSQSLQYR